MRLRLRAIITLAAIFAADAYAMRRCCRYAIFRCCHATITAVDMLDNILLSAEMPAMILPLDAATFSLMPMSH